VNDLLHNTTDVTIALGIIEWTEFCRCLVVVGVRIELVAGELYMNNVSTNNIADVQWHAPAFVRE
jgi:hypothetical protein